MANVFAIHSVCSSIATFLGNTYPAEIAGRALPPCKFEVLSSEQVAGTLEEIERISLLLYRVTVNEHSRAPRPGRLQHAEPAPLGLDLHILLTTWSASAMKEQVMLAWAIRQLHLHPLLDVSSLSPEAGWDRDEVIQIVPAELSTEDIMRIWDALEPSYRLSVSYIARMVRLDSDEALEALPVVASRLAFGTEDQS